MTRHVVCTTDQLPPGSVTGVPGWAVGNTGTQLFAVSRRCRHLGGDLANGTIDRSGCLVCPWHGARYDVTTGRMTKGPQGVFARIPGFDTAERVLTRVWPLRRRRVSEDAGEIVLDD